MQSESTTGPQPAPCTCCTPCTLYHFVAQQTPFLPALPPQLDYFADAIAAVVADPETRTGLEWVLDHCDGMSASCRATAARILTSLDPAEKALLTFLLREDTREELRGMVSMAEQHDA